MRTATLKISAPHDLATRALACKLRRFGAEPKSWNEMIQRTFLRPAKSSTDWKAFTERSSRSTYWACGKNREINSRLRANDKLFAPPSSGWRAVIISGLRNIDIFFSSSFSSPTRRSSRSSKRSGGCDIRVANRKSARVAITPTTREWTCLLLTDLCAIISCLRGNKGAALPATFI